MTLRTRFFLLLMGFMLFCFAINFSADQAHDYIQKTWDTPTHQENPTSEFVVILSVNLALLPAVLGLGWWLARRMTKPVTEAAEMAGRIAGGQLKERMPVPAGPVEVASLVQALNQAFDRYDDDLQRMRRFSAHAAHQLRTPLAALRAQVEVTLNRPRTEQDYRETLHVVLERLQGWTQSVEQILALSELEAGQWTGRFTRVDGSALLARVVENLSILAEEKNASLRIETSGPAWVEGDEILLEQLFANLLDNAIRFAPPEGSVQCRIILAHPDQVRIRIEDDGPGIPASQRLHVLERFNKGNRPDTPGAGLGLAIAVEIARLHKATLTIQDHCPRGTAVEVLLPAWPSTRPDPS